MAKYRISGLDKIEMGACGADGAMGATLSELKIADESAIMEIGEAEVKKFFLEGVDAPDIIKILGKNRLKELQFSVPEMSIDSFELFLGGATVTGKWSASITDIEIYQSIKITTVVYAGFYYVIDIPRALIIGKLTLPLKKGEIGKFDVKAIIESPEDASNVPLSPYQITPTAEA